MQKWTKCMLVCFQGGYTVIYIPYAHMYDISVMDVIDIVRCQWWGSTLHPQEQKKHPQAHLWGGFHKFTPNQWECARRVQQRLCVPPSHCYRKLWWLDLLMGPTGGRVKRCADGVFSSLLCRHAVFLSWAAPGQVALLTTGKTLSGVPVVGGSKLFQLGPGWLGQGHPLWVFLIMLATPLGWSFRVGPWTHHFTGNLKFLK